MDAHNHALAALRYLIASLDERHLAKNKHPPRREPPPLPEANERTLKEVLEDERLWREGE